MIRYGDVEIPDIPTKYRIYSVGKRGDLTWTLQFEGKEKISTQIEQIEAAGRRIIMVEQTIDVTGSFYRV